METVHTPQVLILACGALATEIRDITRLHRLGNVTLECLPGILHNRPSEIPDAVRARLDRARGNYDRILLGYGDCGTGGELADIAAQEGIEMLPGAHCYQFFAGQQVFDAMHDEDPTAFYLTDYLVKHFDRIILVGGAPLNEEFGDAIGADAYCRDAAVAAETASAKVAEKRAA